MTCKSNIPNTAFFSKSDMCHIFVSTLSCLLLIICLLLAACNDDKPNGGNGRPDSSTTPVPTQTTPTGSPDDNTDDIPKNPDSQDKITPLINIEEARQLILRNIDITKYRLELIDDYLVLGDEYYYLFIVKEDNVVLTPALAVNQLSPEVRCYGTDGSLTAFNGFEYYQAFNNVKWIGTFVYYDMSGNYVSDIEVTFEDDQSFMFRMGPINGHIDNVLSGTAQVDGNAAIYSVGGEPVVYFVKSERAVMITYMPVGEPDDADYTFSAVFYVDGEENVESMDIITEDEAMTLVLFLDQDQTALPEPVENYILQHTSTRTYIKGEECYQIEAYVDLYNRNELVQRFYVAMDGGRIFRFDISAMDDVVIYGPELEDNETDGQESGGDGSEGQESNDDGIDEQESGDDGTEGQE